MCRAEERDHRRGHVHEDALLILPDGARRFEERGAPGRHPVDHAACCASKQQELVAVITVDSRREVTTRTTHTLEPRSSLLREAPRALSKKVRPLGTTALHMTSMEATIPDAS